MFLGGGLIFDGEVKTGMRLRGVLGPKHDLQLES